MATAFETTPCGRCGGGGSYSFNLMHGSTCYGCGGTGKVLTKRGKAAQKAFRQSITRPANTVQPGWLVWWADVNPMAQGRWVRVNDVQEVNGATEFTTPGGTKAAIGPATSPIRAVESVAERDAAVQKALALQATLNPKTGKVAA